MSNEGQLDNAVALAADPAPNLINGIDFRFAMDTYAGEVTDRRVVGTRTAGACGAATPGRGSEQDLITARHWPGG